MRRRAFLRGMSVMALAGFLKGRAEFQAGLALIKPEGGMAYPVRDRIAYTGAMGEMVAAGVDDRLVIRRYDRRYNEFTMVGES